MAGLRLVFLGTPAFALPSLEALHAAGHQILAVYSQPARERGRGHKVEPSPVAARAMALGLAVRTPPTLRDETEQRAFAALQADAAIVVAYGLILPRAMLGAPRLGCLNAHASLLPRWRGAAPIERAIMAGDAESGVTIMRMEAGLDSGPILLAEAVPIAPETHAGQLSARLAALSATLLVRALTELEAGRLKGRPQDERGVTYARKLEAAEEVLDWRRPAADLERQVRALAPKPGAHFLRAGERIKVLAARVEPAVPNTPEQSAAPAGTIVDAAFGILCGDGVILRPLRLQRPGRAALGAGDFLRGIRIAPGEQLPCPATD
jgi:methionyl-tRNA formyltransferase